MLNSELTSLSTKVAREITSKPKGVIKASLQTLKEVKQSIQTQRFQLDSPLIDIVSRFSIEGIDWNVLIGKIIDLHKETKPRSVKVFRWDNRWKKGTLILPSTEKGFIYELDSDYDIYSGVVSFNKYALDISEIGELPEIKIGALVKEGLTMKPLDLEGSRVFLNVKIFNQEMFTHRSLYRTKLAASLLDFTALVVKNINQR
jgi:hypothetical protein